MYHPAGLGTYTLAGSISSTVTSITLSSFKVPITNTDVTMATMDTTVAYGTISPGAANAEFISFTGITQNANGTATLTGVTRGLNKESPYTSSSSFKRPHSGQATFILSNSPNLYDKFSIKENDETFSGLKTFSTLPDTTAGNPTTDNQFARKAYVDSVATGGTTTNRVVVAGTAGETIAAGNLVYIKAADGRWWLCDADTAATVDNVQLGIAQGAGTAGNSITSGVLTYGLDTNQTGLTANTTYYASNTAGAISSTPGTTEVTIGFSQSTTSIFFDPRFNQQITEDQQDALVGNNTDQTVGTGNKYVTQTGLIHNAEKYAADAGSNDTYVITLSPAPTSYTNGMVVYFKANTINTGAATLNVNGLGAKTIVKGVNTTLADGDILAGQFCTVIYDGTSFVLQNPVGTNTTSKTPSNGNVSLTASGTTTVTANLLAGRVDLYATVSGGNGRGYSIGSYTASGNRCAFLAYNSNGGTSSAGISSTNSLVISDGNNPTSSTAIINNITATTFDIVFTKGTANVDLVWTAVS